MANVNMDLAELKALEQKIELLEKEKQTLVDNQHQVVIIHKHYDGKIVYGDKAKDKNLHISGFEFNGRYGTQPFLYGHNTSGNSSSYNSFEQSVSFDELIKADIFKIELNHDNPKTTKDYKNMSEVISEIRGEEEQKVSSKLNKAIERANQVEVASETLIQDHEKEIIRLNKKHKEEIEKIKVDNQTNIDVLIKLHDKKTHTLVCDYNKLKQDFSAFKEDKKTLSLEGQIKQLSSDLEKALKPKKLIDRILNK